MEKTALFDQIIHCSFYLLFFCTPLLFSPWNFELFEFPKMYFVYLLTTIITPVWLGKMIFRGKLKIRRTPLDIPIILYLISSILSTIFSIHPYTSFWGYYSRSHGGLVSTICYILLFYAFTSNFNKKKSNKVIKILLVSTALVASYGILEHFGVDSQYWVQDVKNRVFSTLGQPNWLGAMLAALIFIPLSYWLKTKKPLPLILYALFFFCLIFTNSKSAILAFWLGLALFLGFHFQQQKKQRRAHLAILGLTILIYIVLGSKTYTYVQKLPSWLKIWQKPAPKELSQLVSQPDKPFVSESSDIRKIVWQGALQVWRYYPVLGSGLETFGYSYYNHRPQAHNLLSEWDFLYNKAHNEFLNILACQGAVGLITYLTIIITFILYLVKKVKKNNHLYLAFLSGYLTLLITNFFGFSVVMTGLLFWLIPALSFNLNKNKSKNIGFQFSLQTISQSLILITLLGVLLTADYKLVNRFRADLDYAQAEKLYQTDNLAYALPLLQKAIQLNPGEALYHAYMAKTTAKLAVAYNQLEDEESKLISQQLEQVTQLEIEQTLALNPVHLNFWKNKAEVYLLLSYLKDEYKNEAKKALLQASQLALTDAKILYNLGLLEKQDNNSNQAIAYWQKAIQLKPNYEPAYLSLAEIYLEGGEKEKAKKTAEFILNKLNPQNQTAQEILEEI